MIQPLEQTLLESWPRHAWSETRLLVAVSGGADSVALLRALVQVADRKELINVAHFNHQWRGEESDDDEQFVRDLCSKLMLPLTCERANASGTTHHARSEQAARDLRYSFLTQAAYALGARYVVTAHTASDRVETMLHNLCRGTGLSGVAVPTQFRNLHDDLVLARPMLHTTRAQVVAYLDAIGQTFREDSSNTNAAFKRNFIRHRLLPLLRESYGEHADEHLRSFSHLAESATEALRYYASNWIDASIAESLSSSELHFPTASLANTPWPVVQAALEICWKRNQWPLQSMTREHWRQIRHFSNCNESTTHWGTTHWGTTHWVTRHWVTRLSLPGNLQLATMNDRIRIAAQ